MLLVFSQWMLHYVARMSGRDLSEWPLEEITDEYRRGFGAALGRLLFVIIALSMQAVWVVDILRHGPLPLYLLTTVLGWGLTAVNIVRWWRAPRVPDP